MHLLADQTRLQGIETYRNLKILTLKFDIPLIFDFLITYNLSITYWLGRQERPRARESLRVIRHEAISS